MPTKFHEFNVFLFSFFKFYINKKQPLFLKKKLKQRKTKFLVNHKQTKNLEKFLRNNNTQLIEVF